jgi:hypothetical protein
LAKENNRERRLNLSTTSIFYWFSSNHLFPDKRFSFWSRQYATGTIAITNAETTNDTRANNTARESSGRWFDGCDHRGCL